ncbi:putative small nucleolar ribonucleoprotein complex subunit Utp15 [Pseudomassariella vexata]|uniref:Putative small nucleolar ribonucleo protein complex subunit Utp15 n=1 Tax=Pseudomassariella vexata TaxID=1141098 RepID=A0A1Y2E1D5_9PEZI|nr:putative small nucleolar ribonucleoprotein complex subunit Utp15 [Pseudomassariella vexata]ORY65340.1 putative small nucleolar ribonucleo protein complex subunit Utp15 [Pseudomassariella vexata]
MAAEVVPLPQLKLPSGPAPITAEQRYWKTFKNQLVIPSPTQAFITHINFPAVNPSSLGFASNDLFAVTTGTRVQLFSIRTRKLVKTITRFGHIARSGDVRRDGKILVAGDDSGKIQVFDILQSRAILKTWTEHKQPVWTTKFSPADVTTLMSTSDDKTVRLWDLPSQHSTTTFVGHQDYVRSGTFLPGTMSNMLVSGSYDSTVKLWDPRAPRNAVMSFKHAAPIEAVLPLPSGTQVLASSESQISVLDLVAAKPLHLITNHQKTVTSLSLASGGKRVVSGGLDGHVKIFETTGWNVVAGVKYPSPVLAVSVITSGANGDDRHLAVGMQSGVLSIRTRLTGPEATREREREKEMAALLAGNIASHDKAKNKRKRLGTATNRLDILGEGADVVIAGNPAGKNRSKKEKMWQQDLRRGRFVSALDRVLDTSAKEYTPLTVLTLLIALRHRSALREALEGRDEETVQPVLNWIQKHIVDPRYVDICVDVAMHLLDLYAEYTGGSKEMEEGFRLLHRRVRQEVERAQMATQTGGMLIGLLVGME